MAALRPDWRARLGEDHVVRLDALAAISETALTREVAIEIAENGLPTTFVPGRNLLFLAFAGALAYRRGAKHLVAGMCETDFSGYPDCRDDTIKAMQLALNLGMDRRFVIHTPLMWIDKAATFALAQELGGHAFVDLLVEETHTCYLGDRSQRHDWGYGCGECPACRLRAEGFAKWKENAMMSANVRGNSAHQARGPSSCAVRTHHSGGELADRQCRRRSCGPTAALPSFRCARPAWRRRA